MPWGMRSLVVRTNRWMDLSSGNDSPGKGLHVVPNANRDKEKKERRDQLHIAKPNDSHARKTIAVSLYTKLLRHRQLIAMDTTDTATRSTLMISLQRLSELAAGAN